MHVRRAPANKTVYYLFHYADGNTAVTLDPGEGGFLRRILDPRFMNNVLGSALLRSLMHPKIVDAFKPKGWRQLCTTEYGMKDSIVIVHKRLFGDEHILSTLRANNNIIVFDIIDSQLSRFHQADALLCCSHKAYAHYNAVQTECPVYFTEHCLDIRLGPKAPPPARFSAFYFGAMENLLFYNSIFAEVRPCFTAPYEKFPPLTDWMDYLDLANFHYALRPPMEGPVFKPFTKGFVAAAYAANILVHASDGDALHYLGEDYPYLLHEPLCEAAVLESLARAKKDFGGTEWRKGIDVMQRVAQKTAPERIAGQFWKLISEL